MDHQHHEDRKLGRRHLLVDNVLDESAAQLNEAVRAQNGHYLATKHGHTTSVLLGDTSDITKHLIPG
jgi:hypothetical protein